MVEKHRNGPVGRIELYFNDEQATFNTIEKNDFGDFASSNDANAQDDGF